MDYSLDEIIKFRLRYLIDEEGNEIYDRLSSNKEDNLKILKRFDDYLEPYTEILNKSLSLNHFKEDSTLKIIEYLITNKERLTNFYLHNFNYLRNNIHRRVSTKDRYEVCKRQNWNCNICGVKLRFGKRSIWEGEIAHIDHIHPFAKRESYPNGIENINESSNLQALCPNCNLKKSRGLS